MAQLQLMALREINPQVNIVAVSGLTNSNPIAQMMGNEIQAFLAKTLHLRRIIECFAQRFGLTERPDDIMSA
jgi:hypothetical protein